MPILLYEDPEEALEAIELRKCKLREYYKIEVEKGCSAHRHGFYAGKMSILLEIERDIKTNRALFT